MQIEVVQSAQELAALATEWNDLVEKSASDVPFLRHEYLSAWWETLGGGEWTQADLYVVTARLPDGSLAGIAPLFFSPNREGELALLLLGCIEISDYLDIIAPASLLSPFLEALLSHLASPAAPPWQVLDWWNIKDESITLEALKIAAEKRGWCYTVEPLQHCPHIPLPGDWETYLAGIDKKQRHEIRRKIRRVEESGLPVRWYIVQDEASLGSEMEAFFEMMSQDLEKRNFLTPAMRKQFHLSTQAAFRAGWLQLAFLEIAGQKAAGYLNFDYKNQLWIYNSAINFAFREYSPGWVLLGYLLRWANENKRQYFDFMRGDEDYKYRFGGIDRRVYRAIVRR